MRSETEISERIKALEELKKMYEDELVGVPKNRQVGDLAVKKQLIAQCNGELEQLYWVLGTKKQPVL